MNFMRLLLLYELLEAGIITKVATNRFEMNVAEQTRNLIMVRS